MPFVVDAGQNLCTLLVGMAAVLYFGLVAAAGLLVRQLGKGLAARRAFRRGAPSVF